MQTIREQRNEFLKKIGMTEKGFNKSVKVMVAKETKSARKTAMKKARIRRHTKEWKHRNKSMTRTTNG